MPEWLTILSIASLCVAAICAVVIAVDLLSHPQKMWIINVVWPVTTLHTGPLAVLSYFNAGRLSSKESVMAAKQRGDENPGKKKPFWQIVVVGATHCGSGCTLGDLAAEWIIFAAPLVIFGQKIFGGWVTDYIWAYLFGIVFQYSTIKPMKGLSTGQSIWAAIKADTLSLSGWQVGMYGWMAIVTFLIFGHEIEKNEPGVLVHDANRHALRVLDLIPCQLAADREWSKRGNVSVCSSRAGDRKSANLG